MKKGKALLLSISVTLGAVLVLAASAIGYFYFNPGTGAAPSGEHRDRISQSPNYVDGRFVNLVPTSVSNESTSWWGVMRKLLFERTQRSPDRVLPTDWQSWNNYDRADTAGLHVTWFGHSTVLLEMGARTILIDPMFNKTSSPVPMFGRRFRTDDSIPVETLPDPDIVVITHDHYDHLDRESILRIDHRVGHYIVPLGVGSHLQSWGIDPSRITELDWWQQTDCADMTIVATPARHFSGRAVPESNRTLWASFVIKHRIASVFLSGDGGYFDVFREIGDEYGPFDFTLMECGQYNRNWADIHMLPEESVQAHLDVGGDVLMPVHWGAFDLSLHAWDEPPDRLVAEAERLDVRLALPRIGQRFSIANPPDEKWWRARVSNLP